MAVDEYATQVLADGPVGYWRLAEPLGSTTAADASGNGGTGECSGGVTFGQTGPAGGDTAAVFDGSTGRISVPNSEVLNPGRITMEAVVRWDGPTGVQQRILEKESFAGTTQYGLSVKPDGRMLVELRRRVPGPPDLMVAESRGVLTPGAGAHVAATYDGLDIRIYIDGSLDSTTNVNGLPVDIDIKWPAPVDHPETALALGDRMAMLGGQRTFNGLIDEAVVFPVALAPERIRAHYTAALAPTSEIRVSATDNELYILAIAASGLVSSELCHIKSGFDVPVSYVFVPQSILPAGQYTLVLIGINWGGPQAFGVTLTTGGVDTLYAAPASSAVGANWTVAIPIKV